MLLDLSGSSVSASALDAWNRITHLIGFLDLISLAPVLGSVLSSPHQVWHLEMLQAKHSRKTPQLV